MKKVALLCLFSVSSVFAVTPSMHDYLVREYSSNKSTQQGPPPGKNKECAHPPQINKPQGPPPGRGKLASESSATRFHQAPPGR